MRTLEAGPGEHAAEVKSMTPAEAAEPVKLAAVTPPSTVRLSPALSYTIPASAPKTDESLNWTSVFAPAGVPPPKLPHVKVLGAEHEQN